MLCCFCFNDTATTDVYSYLHTLSLHDALPIWSHVSASHYTAYIGRRIGCRLVRLARSCEVFRAKRCFRREKRGCHSGNSGRRTVREASGSYIEKNRAREIYILGWNRRDRGGDRR